MNIRPAIYATPDRPVVVFREPRELVDLDRELPLLLKNQGWHVGLYFNVQFVSHDRTELLATAQFVVTSVREALVTTNANPDQPITSAVSARRYERITEWLFFGGRKVHGKAVWNVGRGGYVIEVDGEEVGFEKDKETAQRIAAGEVPLVSEAA